MLGERVVCVCVCVRARVHRHRAHLNTLGVGLELKISVGPLDVLAAVLFYFQRKIVLVEVPLRSIRQHTFYAAAAGVSIRFMLLLRQQQQQRSTGAE